MSAAVAVVVVVVVEVLWDKRIEEGVERKTELIGNVVEFIFCLFILFFCCLFRSIFFFFLNHHITWEILDALHPWGLENPAELSKDFYFVFRIFNFIYNFYTVVFINVIVVLFREKEITFFKFFVYLNIVYYGRD